MFNIFFKKQTTLDLPIRKYTEFDYIRNRYKEELVKIKEYYRNKDNAVNNTNLLSRLVYNISPNIELDIIDYYKIVDANAIYTARQFGLVSNISNGKVLENNLYSDNSYEIFNYVSKDIDIIHMVNNWIEYKPVNVTYTENTNIDYRLLNGRLPLDKISLTVIEVDLIMMSLMYKFWAKDRIRNDKSTNTNVFIATIIVPNILDSMLDITIFNRFIDIYRYGSSSTFDIKHPFTILDYTKGIDKVLTKVVKDVDNRNYYIEQLLLSIPTIVSNNMLDALYIDNPIYTRQSEWSILAARIDYIVFILEILGVNGIKKNKDDIYKLRIIIKNLENGSTNLFSKLPDSILPYVKYNIDKIKNIIGSR